MSDLNSSVLQKLADEIHSLSTEMGELESKLLAESREFHPEYHHSARNLAHYLALRRRDIRELQSQLALVGLSSLGRTESHVLSSLDQVYRVLNRLLGEDKTLPLKNGN